jgi:hypothetical protein
MASVKILQYSLDLHARKRRKSSCAPVRGRYRSRLRLSNHTFRFLDSHHPRSRSGQGVRQNWIGGRESKKAISSGVNGGQAVIVLPQGYASC